jgi:NTE family protein
VGSATRVGRKIGGALGRLGRVLRISRGHVGIRDGIGLALGGGFARGIAHIGVLQVFEEEEIKISHIAGVSAGAIIAAAYASGTPLARVESVGRKMRFSDLARWTISRMGLVTSERMTGFLRRLLTVYEFERMKIPLAVVATDLAYGDPRIFKDRGDVILPIRASCSYPGLFMPVQMDGNHLVDGAISMDVPAAAVRAMGARSVVAVSLRAPECSVDTDNMLSVVNRCIQILQERTEDEWRQEADVVVEPDVAGFAWDGFENTDKIVMAGRAAALAALPAIKKRLAEAS